VTTGKKQNIALHGAHAFHHAISPGCDLQGRFSTGAAVAEKLPPRVFRQYVNRQTAFVLAVVPLDQVAIDLSCRSKAGQFTGPHGALQRACEHFRKRLSTQPFPQLSGVAFPALRKR
jgi:hypothetical protein